MKRIIQLTWLVLLPITASVAGQEQDLASPTINAELARMQEEIISNSLAADLSGFHVTVPGRISLAVFHKSLQERINHSLQHENRWLQSTVVHEVLVSERRQILDRLQGRLQDLWLPPVL